LERPQPVQFQGLGLTQNAPAVDVRPEPLVLREPARVVLKKLAAELGIDFSSFSEEQMKSFESMLQQGKYEELAKATGFDLQHLPPERLTQLQRIVTGEATEEAVDTSEPPVMPQTQTDQAPGEDPYQKLRDSSGVDRLYDRETDAETAAAMQEQHRQGVRSYMDTVAQMEEQAKRGSP
jgi:hypothetical protein